MKYLNCLFLFSILLVPEPSRAQAPQRLIFVTTDPSGACNSGQSIQWNPTSGKLSACVSSLWKVIATGTGSGGTVTSVTIAGTTNQIAVTGTCTVVTSGTCTLSLPSGVTFVAPNLGTPASGNASNLISTTQSQGDNSTKLSTTAYTDLAVANAIAGINPAVAVQAATTSAANTSGFTYTHVAGIGDFFTGTVNTAITIDGFTYTALGQRLLIKNDTQSPSGAFNGVYYVTQLQTSLLAPILTRALDYDTPSDMNNTGSIPVINGTVNGSTSWLMTAQVVTVGTTPLTFVIFSYAPSTVVQTTRNINTTSPLGGGGSLSSDLTLTCTTCSTGGSGALTQISQQILGSPASTVTFSSIPGTYTNLILTFTARNSSGSEQDVTMNFNGDNAGNYTYSLLVLNSGTSGLGWSNSTNAPIIGWTSGTASNYPGNSRIFIGDYANTTFNKNATSLNSRNDGTSVPGSAPGMFAGAMTWGSTAAITSIVLGPRGGNFTTGSIFTLYGEK